jgi:hypothetical protein
MTPFFIGEPEGGTLCTSRPAGPLPNSVTCPGYR